MGYKLIGANINEQFKSFLTEKYGDISDILRQSLYLYALCRGEKYSELLQNYTKSTREKIALDFAFYLYNQLKSYAIHDYEIARRGEKLGR